MARILPLPLPPRIAEHEPAARANVAASHAIDEATDAGVRWSLVMNARTRLQIGYYDRRNVRGWVADAVLREIQSS